MSHWWEGVQIIPISKEEREVQVNCLVTENREDGLNISRDDYINMLKFRGKFGDYLQDYKGSVVPLCIIKQVLDFVNKILFPIAVYPIKDSISIEIIGQDNYKVLGDIDTYHYFSLFNEFQEMKTKISDPNKQYDKKYITLDDVPDVEEHKLVKVKENIYKIIPTGKKHKLYSAMHINIYNSEEVQNLYKTIYEEVELGYKQYCNAFVNLDTFIAWCVNNEKFLEEKYNFLDNDKIIIKNLKKQIDELNNELSRPRIYGMITIVENCKKKNMDRKETAQFLHEKYSLSQAQIGVLLSEKIMKEIDYGRRYSEAGKYMLDKKKNPKNGKIHIWPTSCEFEEEYAQTK